MRPRMMIVTTADCDNLKVSKRVRNILIIQLQLAGCAGTGSSSIVNWTLGLAHRIVGKRSCVEVERSLALLHRGVRQ